MRDDVSNYISSSLELGKLEVYEKISLGSAAVIYGLLIGAIVLIAFFFTLVTVGLYLGELLQNFWAGFGIVAAFAFLTLLCMLLLKKYFNKKFTNKVIRFLMSQDDEKEDKKRDK